MMWTLVCVDGYGNRYTVCRSNDQAQLNRLASQRNMRVAKLINAMGRINRAMADDQQRQNLDPHILRGWRVVETVVLV